MLKHPNHMAVFASLYLLVYVLFIQLGLFTNLVYVMFFLSPVIVLALAWSVLRYGQYDDKDFTNEQEWGYHDRPDKTQQH